MFDKKLFRDYYGRLEVYIVKRLRDEDPKYLLTVDETAYIEHLVAELVCEPLDYDESALTAEPITTRARKAHDFFDEVVDVETPMIRLRIPVSRHPQRREFFEYRPDVYRLSDPSQSARPPTAPA